MAKIKRDGIDDVDTNDSSENTETQTPETDLDLEAEYVPQETQDSDGVKDVDNENKDTDVANEEAINDTVIVDDIYADDIDDELGERKRKKNIFVEMFSYLENFKVNAFKKTASEKKEVRKIAKSDKKKLKKSATTIEDVQKQRSSSIKNVAFKLGIIGIVVIFITVAVILSLQDNEQLKRANINMKKVLNDTTSFGGIDQKDYFLEQNILDDKINIVEKKAELGRAELKSSMLDQTSIITQHMDEKIGDLKTSQEKKIEEANNKTIAFVEEKIVEIRGENTNAIKKIKALEKKVKKYRNSPQFGLNGGKLTYLNTKGTPKGTKIINKAPPLNVNINESTSDSEGVVEDEYELVEIDMSGTPIQELTFDTGLVEEVKEVKKGFEFDLTTTLVRVTLINGIKAPTLDIGVKNPTPVLMSVDGIAYAANNNKDVILKGCLLRGVAIGNINTSRAEIFGTHLSCILEGDSGEKYKVEHTFPNNEVWIKGEDGSDGVAGLIVDSSGKILAKSAAIGFMQGLTNYFSAQSLISGTNGLNGGSNNSQNQNFTQQLGTSMQSGVGTGLSNGFDLIISKYEQILGGYYPFIDVKGGRKNLTAVFGGGVKLKATPYIEAHLERY